MSVFRTQGMEVGKVECNLSWDEDGSGNQVLAKLETDNDLPSIVVPSQQVLIAHDDANYDAQLCLGLDIGIDIDIEIGGVRYGDDGHDASGVELECGRNQQQSVRVLDYVRE